MGATRSRSGISGMGQRARHGQNEAMIKVVGEVAKTDPRKAAEMIAKWTLNSVLEPIAWWLGTVWSPLTSSKLQTLIRTLPADDQKNSTRLGDRGPFR
jgi:hypothetical protein